MSEELQLLPGIAGTDDGSHDGGEHGESCHAQNAGDEDLLGCTVVLCHWTGGSVDWYRLWRFDSLDS